MQLDLRLLLNDPQALESLLNTALAGPALALGEKLGEFANAHLGVQPAPIQLRDMLIAAFDDAVLVGRGQYMGTAKDARAALLLLVSASNITTRVFEAATPSGERGRMLSTEEVAKRLNVSRPYVIKLADAGKLGVVEKTEGGQRRISAEAVEAYRGELQSRSRKALKELGEDSQEI
jgi:excisionase family DNA binding protein